MNKRMPIMIAALLAASTFTGAYAKSYELRFERPLMAGAVQVPAGQYRLVLKDATAILTNTDTGKDFKISVKVTNTDQRFKDTQVHTGANEHIKFIQLGGSKTRLDFEN